MPKKITPERIAGVVALTYLVLIPAAAIIAYRKIMSMDQDLTDMWHELKMPNRH